MAAVDDPHGQVDEQNSPWGARRPVGQRNDGPDEEEEIAIPITSDVLDHDPHAHRVDFERRMPRSARLTSVLILVNCLVFAWQVATGSIFNAQGFIDAGALTQQEFLQGQYWRLLTSMFLHADPSHLIGNCVVLYILGMACEHALGCHRTLVVYLTSGLAGGLLCVAFTPGPIVGASGAIFGVLGCVTAFLHQHRHRLYVRDKRIGVVLLIWAGWQVVVGELNPQIANLAHVGGLLAGSVFPLILAPRAELGLAPE